ncbi:MAG: hypothetical protein ACYCYP_08290 [Leptospirales bacterium]
MTYCAALNLDAGLVFGSDSRTHAGVDDVSSFCKMRIFERVGDRVLVILSSGNLGVTQATLSLLEKKGKAFDGSTETLWTVPSLFDAARLLGETLREVQLRDGPYLAQDNVDFGASFILGGQIMGEPPRLFNIYSQGNFIESFPETPYFQIGEIKYGKPIIDRVITPSTSLEEGAKCLLVSFDSTMRSNISVGLPIDLLCYERDSFQTGLKWHIRENDPYFEALRRYWSEGLRKVFSGLSDLPQSRSPWGGELVDGRSFLSDVIHRPSG